MKRIVCLIAVLIMGIMLAGCGNMDMFDTTYSFENVMIEMPDGTVIEGKCESWTDYENSDMIQVKINGKTYLTHSENVVLISD